MAESTAALRDGHLVVKMVGYLVVMTAYKMAASMESCLVVVMVELKVRKLVDGSEYYLVE